MINEPITNRIRAERIDAALAAYRSHVGDGPAEPDEAVTDLLTDLRHYCDRENLDIADRDRLAEIHYQAELAEEGDAS